MDFIDLKTQYQSIKEDVQKRINNVLEHGQYIMGPEVFELEERLAQYVGVKYCIGVSSGTDALLIALMALDVKPNDEVIIPAFTFFATGEMVKLLGATPIFVDVDDTYNIDPQKIEEKITNKTKAIIPVSLYGQCADFRQINQIAKKYNLTVIEDGAQSFGATHHGKKSCSLSTVGCTSFFPSKPLGAYGDGGACFTNNDEFAEKMKQIRTHGQQGRYNHVRVGLNGRLDTIQAAVLLSKLKVFDKEVESRQKIAERYTEKLQNLLRTPLIKNENTSVFAQYTIQVGERKQLQRILKEKGIPTAVHYPVPLHKMELFNYSKEDFPKSENFAQRVMSLPMHPYLDEKSQDEIVSVLENLVKFEGFSQRPSHHHRDSFQN